ncbi:hypothetical protein ARSEF1564_003237, partial [Beauveria bassiana]
MPLCIVQARRATVSVVLYNLAMRANGSRSGLSGHMNNATECRSHAARANCRCHAAGKLYNCYQSAQLKYASTDASGASAAKYPELWKKTYDFNGSE